VARLSEPGKKLFFSVYESDVDVLRRSGHWDHICKYLVPVFHDGSSERVSDTVPSENEDGVWPCVSLDAVDDGEDMEEEEEEEVEVEEEVEEEFFVEGAEEGWF
jgi:hypothetical protein